MKEKTIIDNYRLTPFEVWEIVRVWYTNGMYPDILQDENGEDLEGICENHIMDMPENERYEPGYYDDEENV